MVNRYVHVYILCVHMFVCVYVWIRTCKYMHMHANLSARVRRHAYTFDSLPWHASGYTRRTGTDAQPV